MRTLILGARGQLGRDLDAVFRREGGVTGFDLPELDITDAEQVRDALYRCKPDVLINAAAYTNVEKAESDPESAFQVNAEGAGTVARMANEAQVPVVYFSTDYVFGGAQQTPYVESDPLEPAGVYARSKAEGEVRVGMATERHYIVRTAWLYGPTGNCFPKKVLALAETQPELTVVEDEVGSPTHTLDLAEATRALVKSGAFGTYHAVNGGQVSRFELAKAVLALAGRPTPVRPCATQDFPTKAPRPRYAVLATDKLRQTTGYVFRDWHEALVDFMKRIAS